MTKRATAREWVGLSIIALPCMVYAMDLTVLNLAVPAISAELKPSNAELLWIIDIYGFMVAGFLLTMGTLGDRIGRRKLLLSGAAAFTVASAIAAFSNSVGMLIAMRALLGIAGATLAPSTLSLIRNMFDDARQRQFAIGVWIASFSLGGAIGPLVGGVLLEWFAWSSVFWVAVPVMALLLVLGPALLPEYRDPGAGRLDPWSVAMSLAAVLPTIYGFKHAAEHGPTPIGCGAIAIGLVVGAAFVGRQRRLAYPFLDLALFESARFSATIAAYALSCLAMFGVYVFIAQYLQLVLGLTPLEAGFATVPWGAAFLVGSLGTPLLTRRLEASTVLVGGMSCAAAGFALLLFVDAGGGLPTLVAATLVISLGLAPVFTVGNEIVLASAPAERAGAASALSETSSEFSGALGIAIFGSLGTVLYRHELAAAMPPGVPSDVAASALATLGAATIAATDLPPALSSALVATARAAFVHAFDVVALVGTAILLLAAASAAWILRGRPPAPS